MAPHTTAPSGAGRALRRAAAWLDASPSEVLGLVVLLAGSLALTAVLWFRPAPAGERASVPDVVPTGHALVTVHVTGAVQRPGLVELPEGSRVADAVALAGGLSPDAAPAGLNLARPVADGEQIAVPVVPAPGDTGASGGTPPAASAFRPDGRLDLNLATADDLEKLPGIGPVLAERIIAWRDEHGPFHDAGQLREVPGIGERTFQNLADLVTA